MILNKEQLLAVAHHEGPCVITATPGSGKTRVLTERVINLVKNKNVDPKSVLCLTFTNKAAKEMKERIAVSLGDSDIWVSTFHRLCLAILRKHGKLINLSSSFTIYASKEQEELMTKIARMNDYDNFTKSTIFRLMKAANDFREDIVDFKIHLQELNTLEASIVQEYLETLDKFNAVDFSGILYKAWLILINNPAVVEAMSNRFKFIHIDEMQDTNHIQYDIIKRLSVHNNIFVVADPNQSIYGWRGAKPENINQFRKDFIDFKDINLPRNYRSTGRILEAAQKLIRNNEDAKDVYLEADRGDGAHININECFDAEHEAEALAINIESLRVTYKYSWKDFAVLYRINSFSRSIEMALRTRSIPYRIVGGFSFFDRSEVKTTLAYLALLVNPFDTIAFSRAISNPKRFIGSTLIGKLERIAQETDQPILEVCKTIDDIPKVSEKSKTNLKEFVRVIEKYKSNLENGQSIGESANGVIEDSGYLAAIKKQSMSDENDKCRFDNVEEMLWGITDYEKRHPNSTMSSYLQSLQLVAPDISEEKGQESEDMVTLLTMHSSKGLEWPCVYVIGVEEGTIPHARAVKERGEAEERRLMYVAITRAQDHLFLSHCQKRRNRHAPKSHFLNEIEDYG